MNKSSFQFLEVFERMGVAKKDQAHIDCARAFRYKYNMIQFNLAIERLQAAGVLSKKSSNPLTVSNW